MENGLPLFSWETASQMGGKTPQIECGSSENVVDGISCVCPESGFTYMSNFSHLTKIIRPSIQVTYVFLTRYHGARRLEINIVICQV
mgnify:FL=1